MTRRFLDFENDLNVSRTEFGLAIGIQMFLWGLTAPLFGLLADKFGGSTQSHKEIKTRAAINKHAKRVAREGFSANKGKSMADK